MAHLGPDIGHLVACRALRLRRDCSGVAQAFGIRLPPGIILWREPIFRRLLSGTITCSIPSKVKAYATPDSVVMLTTSRIVFVAQHEKDRRCVPAKLSKEI